MILVEFMKYHFHCGTQPRGTLRTCQIYTHIYYTLVDHPAFVLYAVNCLVGQMKHKMYYLRPRGTGEGHWLSAWNQLKLNYYMNAYGKFEKTCSKCLHIRKRVPPITVVMADRRVRRLFDVRQFDAFLKCFSSVVTLRVQPNVLKKCVRLTQIPEAPFASARIPFPASQTKYFHIDFYRPRSESAQWNVPPSVAVSRCHPYLVNSMIITN